MERIPGERGEPVGAAAGLTATHAAPTVRAGEYRLRYNYHDDAQARALCETFDDVQSLRDVCARAVEEYHASFET
jgi:hypothetical protein